MTTPSTVEWVGGVDGHIRMIDQTLLPSELVQIDCKTVDQVWHAIKRLSVRGAPAIGVAAAMGAVVGIQGSEALSHEAFVVELKEATDYLRTSRPTAVNLFWALDRMDRVAMENESLSIGELKERLLDEAIAVLKEDRAMCHAIGRNGQRFIEDGMGVLTHCNAGGLATAEYGTALAVMFEAHAQGKNIHVYADETRPLLQGSRLTTWELMQAGVPVTLICDNMAGQVMKEDRIQAVITGADRIAGNGDAANKIGTYSVAVLAKHHGIPFYIAAPGSTFDLALASGDQIPIEERAAEEVTEGFGKRTAPDNVPVYSPAFDVTPAELIAAIITDRGVIEQPTLEKVHEHLANNG